MSDNKKRFQSIRKVLNTLFPENPQGHLASRLNTLAAMISGIVGSRSVSLPAIASKVPGRPGDQTAALTASKGPVRKAMRRPSWQTRASGCQKCSESREACQSVTPSPFFHAHGKNIADWQGDRPSGKPDSRRACDDASFQPGRDWQHANPVLHRIGVAKRMDGQGTEKTFMQEPLQASSAKKLQVFDIDDG